MRLCVEKGEQNKTKGYASRCSDEPPPVRTQRLGMICPRVSKTRGLMIPVRIFKDTSSKVHYGIDRRTAVSPRHKDRIIPHPRNSSGA